MARRKIILRDHVRLQGFLQRDLGRVVAGEGGLQLIGDPLTADWGFVNVNLRPYYAEGSKTVGYEIAEQLGWRLPDAIVSPVASGSLLTKVDKAFREFVRTLAYPHVEETHNPVYRLFLR